MTNLNFRGQSGFVALISVIIITILLVIISVSISTTSFFSRFNVADGEYKKRSSELAEACVDAALLKLAQDPSYAGGESIAVGSDSCQVVSVSSTATQYTVKTKALFPQGTAYQAVTNLQVTVDSSSFSIISWQELPTL